jgi:protein-disulfide isomerase
VVEFFDYNCGYCKQALGDMEAMVEADPDLRFVIKEFPILGPDSQAAHIVSAALQRVAPDKYPEFHIRLLGSEGRADEASAIALTRDLGVEESALREAMRDPSVMDAFSQTYELASKLQISGTPAYVIGGEVVFGALGAAALTQHVEAARN